VGDVIAPKAPQEIADARLEDGALGSAREFAYPLPVHHRLGRKQLHSLPALVAQLLEAVLRGAGRAIVQTSQTSSLQDHANGRDTRRGMDVCGYIGRRRSAWTRTRRCCAGNFASTPQCCPSNVGNASQGWSYRQKPRKWPAWPFFRASLSLRAAGQGKSSLGRQIRGRAGELLDAYALAWARRDPPVSTHIHQRVEAPASGPKRSIKRWFRVRRPLVVVGGD